MAGATAIITLTEVAHLAAGESVLVQGAGGGVGLYAVQIAKIRGATVIGAAGTSDSLPSAAWSSSPWPAVVP